MRATSLSGERGQVGDALEASEGGGRDVVKHCLSHTDPTDKGIVLKHLWSVDVAENPCVEATGL